MLKKMIAAILSSALLLCAASVSAATSTFPDVTSTSYGWALSAVEDMVEDGIIKGYTDGTFKPDRAVSKIEALVLSSRILGFSEPQNVAFKELATEFYADILSKYHTDYPNEISFLLYKEVLTEQELTYYIGGDNAAAPLKRYEAAKLLTKVMGAVDDTDPNASTASYADSTEIPADVKPFVRFVTDIGLMKGMENNSFAPMVEVNRAQIAVLLYRMRDLLKETYVHGTVKEVDSELATIMYTNAKGEEEGFTISYDEEPIIKQDGYSVEFSRISVGAEMLVTKRDKVIYSIETITTEPDETFSGAIKSLTNSNGKRSITVFPLSDESDVKTYPISKDVAITLGGNSAAFTELKNLQAVELLIKEGEVIAIDATESERTIKGTVESIVLEPELSFAIKLTNGNVETYPMANAATAKRNNADIDVDKVLVGDKVTITLRYEKIFTISASSTKFTVTGTIEEITIATLPSMKIKANNAISAYSISRDCAYTVDGASGTVYDLRLGANITASVDSETITSLTTTAPAVSSAITGKIESFNKAYGFFILSVTTADGTVTTMQVFTKRSNLKVINSVDGSNKTAADLSIGMTVSVTGATASGAFEATTIIIMPE